MLSRSVRVLNLDHSVSKQKWLLSRFECEVIDLTEIGPRVRLWMNQRERARIEKAIQGSAKNAVTFLGSGDFHHLSSILVNQFQEPFSLIVFDLHPDWDTLIPRFGCGSWVSEALRNKNIQKCLLLGVSSDDISTWHLQSANLAALKNNRLEIYPYAHPGSSVFLRKVPENVSLKVEKGLLRSKICWSELKGKNLSEFFSLLLKRLAPKQVYLSIDKDCLKKDFALTNWEEGSLTLEELLVALKLIRENCDIIGMDITGDYSAINISGRFKRFLSRLDHPKVIEALTQPESYINSTNEETNLKILEAVGVL